MKTTLAIALVLALASFGTVVAHEALESHEHKVAAHEDRGEKKRHKNRGNSSPSPTSTNAAYATACGGCHMLYPPQLLPAASWKMLVEQADNHFGQTVPLADKEKNDISTYLANNDAAASSSKLGRKIIRGLGSSTPLRISELSYIQHKHRKLDSSTLARPSIGSLANCKACHPGAENGNFEDDFVRIPTN